MVALAAPKLIAVFSAVIIGNPVTTSEAIPPPTFFAIMGRISLIAGKYTAAA